MRENELADLLIQMAASRGVDVEPAAEELASIALPSFVDARAFRSVVIQTLEAHLRAQMEQRLLSIRRRFDMDPQQAGTVQPRPYVAPSLASPAGEFARLPAAMDVTPDLADATMTDLAPAETAAAPENPSASENEELPSDATMVWTTRHG